MVAAAVIGSAVVGAGATYAASKSQSKAINSAANTEAAASQANIAAAEAERQRNEALFRPLMDDADKAKAYADALSYGSGTYTPPGATQPVTVSRDDVMQAIQGTPLAQLASTQYADRNALADQTYAGSNSLADQEYNDYYGLADQNYNDATGLASQARTGRRDLAQTNLDQRLANNDQIFNAWDAQAQDQANRAIDLNFSRGGVTGLVGQTRAGVAQVGQQYALDAYGKRADLNAAAYDPYFQDVNAAENDYWGDMGAATGARSDARTNATTTRDNRYRTGYDAYSGARAQNYDQYAGDQLGNYSDYNDFLQGRINRGDQGRGAIAGAGQTTLGITTQQNTNAARSAADAAYARANNNTQLYSNLSSIFGDALGQLSKISNTKK